MHIRIAAYRFTERWCAGRPQHRAGGHSGRHGGAEGGDRVRDTQRHVVRPLQKSGNRAEQEHAGQYKLPNWPTASVVVQVHWSEDDMTLALDAVRTGNMSINQVSPTPPQKIFHSLEILRA